MFHSLSDIIASKLEKFRRINMSEIPITNISIQAENEEEEPGNNFFDYREDLNNRQAGSAYRKPDLQYSVMLI